jgi:hypothetical protein
MKDDNLVIKAIKTRRSIRQFKKEPVSDEVVNQILESGLWAPSGENNQPWKTRSSGGEGLSEKIGWEIEEEDDSYPR